MPNGVEVQVAALRATVENSFDALNVRMDDQRITSREQHSENVQRLIRIEAEQRITNGRVTRLEEQIKTVFRRLAELGDEEADGESADLEKNALTIGGLKLIIITIIATIAATSAFYARMGMFK